MVLDDREAAVAGLVELVHPVPGQELAHLRPDVGGEEDPRVPAVDRSLVQDPAGDCVGDLRPLHVDEEPVPPVNAARIGLNRRFSRPLASPGRLFILYSPSINSRRGYSRLLSKGVPTR